MADIRSLRRKNRRTDRQTEDFRRWNLHKKSMTGSFTCMQMTTVPTTGAEFYFKIILRETRRENFMILIFETLPNVNRKTVDSSRG